MRDPHVAQVPVLLEPPAHAGTRSKGPTTHQVGALRSKKHMLARCDAVPLRAQDQETSSAAPATATCSRDVVALDVGHGGGEGALHQTVPRHALQRHLRTPTPTDATKSRSGDAPRCNAALRSAEQSSVLALPWAWPRQAAPRRGRRGPQQGPHLRHNAERAQPQLGQRKELGLALLGQRERAHARRDEPQRHHLLLHRRDACARAVRAHLLTSPKRAHAARSRLWPRHTGSAHCPSSTKRALAVAQRSLPRPKGAPG